MKYSLSSKIRLNSGVEIPILEWEDIAIKRNTADTKNIISTAIICGVQ